MIMSFPRLRGLRQ